MTDSKPSRHWNDLAEQLGLESPAAGNEETNDVESTDTDQESPLGWADSGMEESSLPGPSAPSSAETRSKKRREPKRARALPETDWGLLAGSLGVTLPEPNLPESTERTKAASEPKSEVEVSESVEVSAEVVTFGDRTIGRRETTPADEPPPDTRDNFIDELPDTDEFEIEESETETSEGTEGTEATEATGRKRRRRGRRGRRRRTSKGQGGPEGTPEGSDPPKGEVEADLLDLADEDLADEDLADEYPADEDSVDDDRRPRSRSESAGETRRDEGRRRSRSGRNRDRGELPEEELVSEVASFDIDVSMEQSAASAAPKSRRQPDGDEERGRLKRGGRRFPTWSEAVGVIVNANMESRHKSGSSGSSAPSRGRRRRSGGRKR